MAYFDCQIVQGGGGIILTVECNQVFAGAAITATDGVTTLSQTCPSSSPYEVQFNIPNVGTWTISGTYAGDSYSTQVVIPSSATLSPIPNGSTVTPTDVIQTWLHCADIWDKNYTTISQVLADLTTLLALVSSNNAVDYMARSTSWASSVCADSAAMTIIGNNDYCAAVLLDSSTWRTSICNSTYFESVLNCKVPTMTSDTTPSGKAFATNNYSSSYQAYMAFDGDNNTRWNSASGSIHTYVGYQFTGNVKVYKVDLKPANGYIKNFSIKASNNKTTGYVSQFNGTHGNNAASESFNIIPTAAYPYWIMNVDTSYLTSDYNSDSVITLQFYGRAFS